jgi:hypothetical protein
MTRYSPDKIAHLHPVSPDPPEPMQPVVWASTYDGGDQQQIRSASAAQELDSHMLSSGEAEVSTMAQNYLHGLHNEHSLGRPTISITYALSDHHRTNQCFCTLKDHRGGWTRVDLRRRPHNLPLFSELKTGARWWRRQRGCCPERWDKKSIGFVFSQVFFFPESFPSLSPKVNLRTDTSVATRVYQVSRHGTLQIAPRFAPGWGGWNYWGRDLSFFSRKRGDHDISSVVNAWEGMSQIEPGSNPDAWGGQLMMVFLLFVLRAGRWGDVRLSLSFICFGSNGWRWRSGLCIRNNN